jgi:hypothetical protein
MNIETMLNRPSVRGLEFRLGLEAFTHKMCKSLGLTNVRVTWTNQTETAGINTDGDILLAGVLDEAVINRAMVFKYAGYVVHELLHHKYTNFNMNSDNSYIQILHNAVEDGWIENTGINSGLLGNIGPLLGELIDSMTRQAIEVVQDWNDPRQYPFILAVHCRKHSTVKCPTNPKLVPIFDKAAEKCLKANSSADTLRIAEWVYSQINIASQEKKNNKPQTEDKAQDGPEDGCEEPTSPDQAEGKEGPSGPVQSTWDVIPNGVEPQLKGGDIARSYSSDYYVKKSVAHIGNEIAGLLNTPVPARLRYEVKRLFDNSGLSDFMRNRKSGVVNVHALPSVASGSDRVFKRRLEVEGVDSAVVICLDVSGSMFERKGINHEKPPLIGPAVQTCRALLDTLDKAGVTTSVITFGTYVSVLKPFNKNAKQASNTLGRVSEGGGTNDYVALRHAHQMLALTHARRKIAFVITDGQGKPDAVRQQVSSGRAMGITTIGVGIMFDVADIYGQAVLVNKIADLGNASFKQIKLAA